MKATDSQTARSTVVTDSGDRHRHQFLRFSIQPGLMALLEIEQVMELVNIPIDRVVPMPHLPPATRGVYNWRGEILWIVDLATLLGLGAERRYRSIQPTIVLSSAGDAIGRQQQQLGTTATVSSAKTIGFIVDEIMEIEWCHLDLSSGSVPDRFHSELAPWVKGVWESPTGEDLSILDGQAILDRADVRADPRSDLNYFFR